MKNKLSENLKKLRKENNISQEQLAEDLKVSRQAISKWESGAAYPEMEKIIQLCEKFNVNVDDLLSKNISEIKGEEETKNNLNKYASEILKNITNTINLFFNMSFVSKIKCLFEQFLIGIVLVIITMILNEIVGAVIFKIIAFIPYGIRYTLREIYNSIFTLVSFILIVIIMSHIFKNRYLNYYEEMIDNSKNTDKNNIEENKNEDENKKENNNIKLRKKEEKIIIRDPKNSEFRLLNIIVKLFIFSVKVFVSLTLIPLCIMLLIIAAGFVASFMLHKTGLFFIGLLLSSSSTAVVTTLIIILLLSFILNRKCNKKLIIYTFIVSVITFGISLGLIFMGSLNFEYLKSDEILKTETFEVEMKENQFISNFHNIEYIEEERNNIKVEYKINKVCDVNYFETDNAGLHIYSDCNKPLDLAKQIIENLNKKKVLDVQSDIETIKIYTSKENIEKLNNNKNEYYEKNN